MWFTAEKYIFSSFQIKDHSCRLDSVFGIFSFVGCVMVPEIVVFQEYRVFQQLPIVYLCISRKGKKSHFRKPSLWSRSPFTANKTSLSGWVWWAILLQRCVFRMWQCTWDLIKTWKETILLLTPTSKLDQITLPIQISSQWQIHFPSFEMS